MKPSDIGKEAIRSYYAPDRTIRPEGLAMFQELFLPQRTVQADNGVLYMFAGGPCENYALQYEPASGWNLRVDISVNLDYRNAGHAGPEQAFEWAIRCLRLGIASVEIAFPGTYLCDARVPRLDWSRPRETLQAYASTNINELTDTCHFEVESWMEAVAHEVGLIVLWREPSTEQA